MKISGIVCEYNPLHNGHIYHLNATRKNGAELIAAVISGNFVQRGETALMDKHCRAALALMGGADLVIEIPAVYCLSSAESYARAAVNILDSLGCIDELSFGSECGNIESLSNTAKAVREITSEELSGKMKNGLTYPAAVSEIIREKYGLETADILSSPNNTLAVEYLNALHTLGSGIKPFTIQRYGSKHDNGISSDGFSSASGIRELAANSKDISAFVPEYVRDKYEKCALEGKLSDMKNLEQVILYRLRTISAKQLGSLPDVGQGLEYRLKRAADSVSVKEVLEKVKTKRYTMARLRRIIMNMLIGTTASDQKTPPPYARVLAFNERGREILVKCKKSRIPISTSLSKLAKTGTAAERTAYLEGTASDIYGLSQTTIGSKRDDFCASIRMVKNDDKRNNFRP